MATPFVDLSFAPCMPLVARVRKFVGEFYSETLHDEDLLSRLEMATHELLENAVKGSSDGLTRIRIEQVDEPVAKLRIRTWNRARPNDRDQVHAVIDEIAAAPDCLEHYQVLMERSLSRTDGSGLGLGRVRAEAGMTLSYEDEDELVCITAEVAIEASQLRVST